MQLSIPLFYRRRSLLRYFIVHSGLILATSLAAQSNMMDSVSRSGITWTFDQDYPVGQYANGDYWVLAPSGLTVIEIDPASTLVDGRTQHGSMINPLAKPFAPNGFDSSLSGGGYQAELNVARPGNGDLSPTNSLIVPAGSSLISSSTHANPGNRPQLKNAAVLTVVDTEPPEGSFRPPYCGTDKTPYWNMESLDYSILQSLPKVNSSPSSISSVSNSFDGVWIEIDTQYTGREFHPSSNQPAYGRDLARSLERGLLTLHLDYTNEEKEPLYVRLVQIGIDFYGAAATGARWSANGGHNQGRKMPMLLAGLALDDPNILEYADKEKHFIFQEDQQTWIVTEADVGRAVHDQSDIGRPRETYGPEHVGLPEWGITHSSTPWDDGSNWGVIYRNVVYGSLLGHTLAAHLTPGAVEAWNWEPFFLYMDRVWDNAQASEFPNFSYAMWAAYRDFESLRWKGFSRDADGFINTGEPLGWFWAQSFPWMYSYTLEKWIYVRDTEEEAQGFWTYLPNE